MIEFNLNYANAGVLRTCERRGPGGIGQHVITRHNQAPNATYVITVGKKIIIIAALCVLVFACPD